MPAQGTPRRFLTSACTHQQNRAFPRQRRGKARRRGVWPRSRAGSGSHDPLSMGLSRGQLIPKRPQPVPSSVPRVRIPASSGVSAASAVRRARVLVHMYASPGLPAMS